MVIQLNFLTRLFWFRSDSMTYSNDQSDAVVVSLIQSEYY